MNCVFHPPIVKPPCFINSVALSPLCYSPRSDFAWISSPVGKKGTPGCIGPVDISGSGFSGPAGPEGIVGFPGTTGVIGPTGSAGPVGTVGPTGPTGPAGEVGGKGKTGCAGGVGICNQAIFR